MTATRGDDRGAGIPPLTSTLVCPHLRGPSWIGEF